MTHTPGPWYYSIGEFISDGVGGHVASAWLLNSIDEREANGNLIAAAPELLDALKATHEELKDDLHEAKEAFQGDIYIQRLEELINKCNQAIAKAEGDA